MWAWYIVLFTLILMALIQFSGKGTKETKDEEKTFKGLREYFPQFKAEVGEELTPKEKRKTESLIEKISAQSMPYFETILTLTEEAPNELSAKWRIGHNLKDEFTRKYGEEFLENSQAVLKVYHLNAFPSPYTQDFEVQLEQEHLIFHLYAPGETVNAQLGVVTSTGAFVLLAQSNDVIIPKDQP